MDRQFVATYAAQGPDQCRSTAASAHMGWIRSQQYYPAVVDDVRYDGKVWAVPQFYQPPAIMLNKRVMAEAGRRRNRIDTSKPDVLLAAAKKMYKPRRRQPDPSDFDPSRHRSGGLWLLGSADS